MVQELYIQMFQHQSCFSLVSLTESLREVIQIIPDTTQTAENSDIIKKKKTKKTQ